MASCTHDLAFLNCECHKEKVGLLEVMSRIAVITRDPFDPISGFHGHELCGLVREVYDIAFSHKKKNIFTARQDMILRLWDAKAGRTGPVLSGCFGPVVRVAFSPAAD